VFGLRSTTDCVRGLGDGVERALHVFGRLP
jgi:hypothetical protein